MTTLKAYLLVVFTLILIVYCVYLDSEVHLSKTKIEKLTTEMGDLREKSYNDSVLVSEYQEALEKYIKMNPKAADEFIRIIEQLNIQQK